MILTILAIALAAGCAAAAWNARAEGRRRSAARVAALAAATGADPDGSSSLRAEAVPAVGRLFESTGGSGSGRRWGQAAAVLVLLIALGALTAVLRRAPASEATRESTPQSSLELLATRHVQRSGVLTVTGLVRNPAAGAPLARVDALVLAFDRAGDFVGSEAAALDIPALAPGEESPFTVTLREVGDLGRYRVAFRTNDTLLRHVDLRGASPMAVVQR